MNKIVRYYSGKRTLGRILLNWIGKDINPAPPKDEDPKTKEMIDKGNQPDKNSEKCDKEKKDGSWWTREKSKSKKLDEVERMDVSLSHPCTETIFESCQEKMEVDNETDSTPDRKHEESIVCQLSGDTPPNMEEDEELELDEQGLVILSSKAIRNIFTLVPLGR